MSETACSKPYEAQAAAFDNFMSDGKQSEGLGLALVRAFAELHGGWVALRSELGEATTVSVHLPTAMTLSIAAE